MKTSNLTRHMSAIEDLPAGTPDHAPKRQVRSPIPPSTLLERVCVFLERYPLPGADGHPGGARVISEASS
jgi:hypothetical protein